MTQSSRVCRHKQNEKCDECGAKKENITVFKLAQFKRRMCDIWVCIFAPLRQRLFDTTEKETKINVFSSAISFCCCQNTTSLRQVKWPLKFHFSFHSIFEFALVWVFNKSEGREYREHAVKEKAAVNWILCGAFLLDNLKTIMTLVISFTIHCEYWKESIPWPWRSVKQNTRLDAICLFACCILKDELGFITFYWHIRTFALASKHACCKKSDFLFALLLARTMFYLIALNTFAVKYQKLNYCVLCCWAFHISV